MKKKLTRIAVVVLLLFAALLIALPFVLEDKVGSLIKANVNRQINGDFDFSDLSLSLFKSFPDARVRLDDVLVINKEPFEGDTLLRTDRLEIRIAIRELFQSTSDPIELKEVVIDSGALHLKINKEGMANYDIVLDDEEASEDPNTSNTVLSLEEYHISNSQVSYLDEESDYLLLLEDIQHHGSGDLSQEDSELDTQTKTLISFRMEDTEYLIRNNLELDAIIGIDLAEDRYTFKENKAILNRLPIAIDGFVELRDDEQYYDMNFATVSSDFSNFLALIPEKYSKDITDLETSGNFDMSGSFKGILSEETIPAFNLVMNADNASFKYPQLSRKVEDIFIDASVENTSGKSEDTSINIQQASFRIDEDQFEIAALISNLQGNTLVDSKAKGSINLSKLAQAYPVPSTMNLEGRIQADIAAAFRMNDVENKNYKNINLSGTITARGLNYPFEALPQPLKVHTLNAQLAPRSIQIREVAGITGTTDFSANGNVQNALGYIFNDEVLRGDFQMRSNSLVVSDLVKEGEEESTKKEEEAFKVPESLDFRLQALIGKAVYDQITLYDIGGVIQVKDETISFREINSRMFDGRLALDGNVNTKGPLPLFNLSLDLSKLDIATTFQNVELMQYLTPVARALEGRLNSKISLTGALNDQLDPDLNSLNGSLVAEILTAKLNPEKSKVANLLGNRLGFVNFNQLDLSGLKTALSFENGLVQIKPFNLSFKDIDMEFSGGHSFSDQLNYRVVFNVPAQYLGNDVNKLLASIQEESLQDVKVPIAAKIGGSKNDPQLSTDLKEQTKLLVDQLVEIQKQKYLNRGKKEVSKLLGEVMSANRIKTDTAVQKVPDSSQKNDSLSVKQDSSQVAEKPAKTEEQIKKAAKNIVGGLLKSKKKDSTAKDSIN